MTKNEEIIEQRMMEVAFESRLIIRLFLDGLKDCYQREQCGVSRSETGLIDSDAYKDIEFFH